MGKEIRSYREGHQGKDTLRVLCRSCQRITVHRVVYTVEVAYDDRDIQAWQWYQILECRGCETVSFRTDWQSTEDFDVDDEGNEVLADHEELFPSRVLGAAPMEDSYLLPPKLMRIYEETHKALSGHMPVLAGVGIRAIVETLCADQGAAGATLAKRIDQLVAKDVITSDGAKILHSLRTMGNEAAHEVKPHKGERLLTAMRVIEHALQGVYVLPRQAESLTDESADELPSKLHLS